MHGSLLEILQQIGPFISGLALLIAAGAAWATFFLINRKLTLQQQHDSWLDSFHLLYAEFWKDDRIATVRQWITNDHEYVSIEKILNARLSENSILLDNEASAKLESIDRFCSLMVRITFFGKLAMTEHQKDLWNIIYGGFWITIMHKRNTLMLYIYKFWPGMLENSENYRENRSAECGSHLWGPPEQRRAAAREGDGGDCGNKPLPLPI